MKAFSLIFIILFCTLSSLSSQTLVAVGEGWANNSVNTTVFRKNSLVTYKDTQFVAYYNSEGVLVLGKRKLNDKEWILYKTQYKGNVRDAHNSISIMVDGDAYLHVSWDHHGHPLKYAKGIAPMALQLGEMQPMTSQQENNVTYPEFFRMPNGDLIFMYRDGESGRGNLVINYYDIKTRKWVQKHKNLIDGENKRNAYWQACVDTNGAIHISWVWRETWDVSTNHDLCYARSRDFGNTWEKSDGSKYTFPITADNAEYICNIPQNRELINQTSMTTDDKGEVFIATYWRNPDSRVPQYRVVYSDKGQWKNADTGFRTTSFSLSGGGTKRIPISRPQIVVNKKNVCLIFRDAERGSKVSMATCHSLDKNKWQIRDLTPSQSVGDWEPSYDTELWGMKKQLHIFVQKVEQVDGEGQANIEPQEVAVMEVEKM